MAEKQTCDRCGEVLEAYHFLDRCERLEFLRAKKEISKLKSSVELWKDAWHHLRDVIGRLWWNHPAIHNDERRAYYRDNQ